MDNGFLVALPWIILVAYIGWLELRKERRQRESHMGDAWLMRHRKRELQAQIAPPSWVNREGTDGGS